MGKKPIHLLFLVSVDRKSRPPILAQVFCNVVRNTLSADENEHLRVQGTDMIQMLNELRTLLKVSADLNVLLDVVVSGKLHRPDVDLNEVIQKILCKHVRSKPIR